MRKIIFTLALIAALMVGCCPANAQETYNPDYKASFFPTGWSIGVAGNVTKTTDFSNWNTGEGLSFGAQLRATKRVGTVWNLRYIADVPGIVTKKNPETGAQFDRYGKLMSGVSLNYLKFAYLFADAGMSFNPSTTARKVGIVGQVGLGFNIDFGKDDYNFNRFFIELGVDRFNNATGANPLPPAFKGWNSNVFATVGYTHTLGLGERDRKKLSTLRYQPERISNLERDLSNSKKELHDINLENGQLRQDLDKCNREKQAIQTKLGNTSAQTTATVTVFKEEYFFEFASAELTNADKSRIAELAERIKSEGGEYQIDGWCSNNGDDETNLYLSQQRAQAVYEILRRNGVGSYITEVTGHGKAGTNGTVAPYGDGTSSVNQMVSVTRK